MEVGDEIRAGDSDGEEHSAPAKRRRHRVLSDDEDD